jgi:cytochrome c biogenesis protein CcmG/thiol:disulfide interchange protein DsbE
MKVRGLASRAAVIAALGLLAAVAAPSFRQGERSLAGRRAPDFVFERNGHPARLADLRGHVVILHFWASWCPPCVEEAPALEALAEALQPAGVIVLGISADEDPHAYEQFLHDHRITFPNYRDPGGKIAALYGTHLYPETYVIDSDGRFVRKLIGPQPWNDPAWVAYFRELAAGRQPMAP